MEASIIWIIAVVGIIFVVMVFMQYRYISELKKLKHDSGRDQNQFYENMSFEQEQLHGNLQGSFWPASLVAQLIYRLRHRKK